MNIAKLAHEINRAYCASIGDHSQVAWEDAPEWQRESAEAGVKYHLSYPEGVSPKKSHNSWLRQKKADGWVYGPVKDPVAKEHPCMVDYEQLPADQRLKDSLFGAVVEACRPFL